MHACRSTLEDPTERLLGQADPHGALEKVQADGVDDDYRLGVRARAALMGGDVAGALAVLGDKRGAPALALADAALSLAEGDLARAMKRVEEALAAKQNGLAERYVQALVKVAEGDMGAAQDALVDVARSAPWHAVARYQLGQLLLAQGDPARAGTLFEMAWSLAPGFVAPALTLAEMLTDSRQYGEALNLVAAITDKAPDAHSPRVLQLRILIEVGEREAALVLAQMLRERAPDDMEVALLHAEALADGERRTEARTVLDDVVQRPGTQPFVMQRAHRLRARLLLAEKPPHADEAVEILKAAVSVPGPLSGELALELFQVAWALGKRGDAEAALDAVEATDDPSSLISGAILARSHAMWTHAKKLAEKARVHVVGTPAEMQLEGFLQSLP